MTGVIPKGSQLFENIMVFENYPSVKSSAGENTGLKFQGLKAVERTNFPFYYIYHLQMKVSKLRLPMKLLNLKAILQIRF